MAASPLDAYASAIQLWLDRNYPLTAIVDLLDDEFGIETTEASVRRAIERNGLSRPAGSPEAADEDGTLLDAHTILARAERAAQDVQTPEDHLRDEVESLRAEVKRAEQVINRFREKETVEKRIVSTIANAIHMKPYETQFSRPKSKSPNARPHEFFLALSDAHYGEVVNPEEALGIKYDTDICRRRIEYVRDQVIRYAELRQTAYPIQKLSVGVLGDMLSGMIHHELAITNEQVMAEQTVDMAHILYNLGADWADFFDEVEFIIIPGNHPRTTIKPKFKTRYDNWEYVMGKMAAGMVDAAQISNLTINVPKDMTYIHEVFGYRIAMMHGDGIMSNSFAGIPFYGMRNRREAIQSLLSQVGQDRVDMFVMGHFHQHLYWEGECDILINGSIKGGDEFGIGTRLSAPDPSQVLLEWHPEHGVTSQNHITLGHIV